MAKILYSQSNNKVKPYPRQDDEPVVGLDPDYLVLDKVTTTPPSYDPDTQYLAESWVADVGALEYQQAWTIEDLPPVPQWTAFNTAMLSDPDWQAWALPADLRNAMIAASINANLTSLENAYAIAKASVPPSAEAIEGWQTLADTYNIPIVF
jgi:hypothetical protein